MEFSDHLILVGAVLVLLSVFASFVSARFGAPLLLVFLVVGMLAGEDGPGGIAFDNFQAAYLIGSLALAVILFDGGLRTRRESFRVARWPALLLATLGVLVTAVVTGLATAWFTGLGTLESFLLGATVASTDAAAVFLLLRASGLTLQRRVGATLEIESGINDPMAVFLCLLTVELLLGRQPGDRPGASWRASCCRSAAARSSALAGRLCPARAGQPAGDRRRALCHPRQRDRARRLRRRPAGRRQRLPRHLSGRAHPRQSPPSRRAS